MIEQFKYLPYSGRRYKVSINGTLYTSEGVEVATLSKNNNLYVKIEWIFGYIEYNLASLVLYTFNLVKLPDHLFHEIVPLYVDSDFTNLSIVNLLYKFKSGKLEVENYPGFYYIPFYTDYAINIAGELINITTGKFKLWSVTKPDHKKNSTGGYFYSRVVNENGFSKTLFQHRALCLVFKDYDEKINSLVVNHRDGNPSNNDLDNLEFTTYYLNNLHAVETGLRGDNKPVLCKNLKTNEILRFSSINACGRFFNQPRAGFVYNRLKFNPTKVYSDMLVFKYDDGTPWPDFDTSKIQRIADNEDYIARNVFTGQLVIFNTVKDGERLFSVKSETIHSHVKKRLLIPVNGWNFRYIEENSDWPQHTKYHLKIYEKYPIYPPDGVFCLDKETNEKIFFESVAICCNKFGFNKSYLHSLMKTKKLYKDKYLFELFDIRKNLGLPTE
jgi:hypothetical protein